MTASTVVSAAELRVGDRIVSSGESKFNAAGQVIEPVTFVGRDVEGRVEVVTRRHSTRTRLYQGTVRVRVLTPRLIEGESL